MNHTLQKPHFPILAYLAMSLAAVLLALAAASAEAGKSPDAVEAAKIRAVIQRQIEAFRRDDARAAFALLSPENQRLFKTPENFLSIVRNSYQPLYRPSSVTFLYLWSVDGELVQQIRISDDVGMVWTALYPVQRQKDGSWKANGCRLMQMDSISI